MKYIWNIIMICVCVALAPSCEGGNSKDEKTKVQNYYKSISVPSAGGTIVVELKDDGSGKYFSTEISKVLNETDWIRLARTNDEKSVVVGINNGIPTVSLIIDENWETEERVVTLALYDSSDRIIRLHITQEAGRYNYTDVVHNIVSTDNAW